MNRNAFISELCRLCLQKGGEDDLFEKADLVKDIYLCTGVKVTKSNNLPWKICKNCLKTVNNAKQFRSLVRENDTHIKIFFDHEDPTQGLDETSTEKDSNSVSTESSSSSEEEKTDDEEPDIKRNKRQRSRSPENVIAKKISVRSDLYTSTPLNSKTENCGTYIEGIKYGISKTSTVNDMNDVDVTYTCAMCPKTFPSWKKVYCHQRMHNKNIACPIAACGKKFASKGDLEKHMRTHTGERPYVCDICDRSFTQRCTLKMHKEAIHQVAGESLVLYMKD